MDEQGGARLERSIFRNREPSAADIVGSIVYQAQPHILQIKAIDIKVQSQGTKAPEGPTRVAQDTGGATNSEAGPSDARRHSLSVEVKHRTRGALVRAKGNVERIRDRVEAKAQSDKETAKSAERVCWMTQYRIRPHSTISQQPFVPVDVEAAECVGETSGASAPTTSVGTRAVRFEVDPELPTARPSISDNRLARTRRSCSDGSQTSVVIHDGASTGASATGAGQRGNEGHLPVIAVARSASDAGTASLAISFSLRLQIANIQIGRRKAGRIFLVAANSAEKLISSIKKTGCRDGYLSGPLATKAAASMKGIEYEVIHEGAFEAQQSISATWHCPSDLYRDLHEGTRKLCCAFVMHDNFTQAMAIMASVQVLIGSNDEGTSTFKDALSSTGHDSTAEESTFSAANDEHVTTLSTQVASSSQEALAVDLTDIEDDSPAFRAMARTLADKSRSLGKAARATREAANATVLRYEEAAQAEAALLSALEALQGATKHEAQEGESDLPKSLQSQPCTERASSISKDIVQPLDELIQACALAEDRLAAFEKQSRAFYRETRQYLSTHGDQMQAAMSSSISLSLPEKTSSHLRSQDADRDAFRQLLRQAQFHLSRLLLFDSLLKVDLGLADIRLSAKRGDGSGTMSNAAEVEQAPSPDDQMREHLHKKRRATAKRIELLESDIRLMQARLSQPLLPSRTTIAEVHEVATDGSVEGGAKKRFRGFLHRLSPMSGAAGQKSSPRLGVVSLSSPRRVSTDGIPRPASYQSSQTSSNLDGVLRRNSDQRKPHAPPDSCDLSRRDSLGADQPNLHPRRQGVVWVLSKDLRAFDGAIQARDNDWNESWVMLSDDGLLHEFSAWRITDTSRSEAIRAPLDLRFATVREARGIERRFAFEVVTRETRRMYQATSSVELQEWLIAIRQAIESVLKGMTVEGDIHESREDSAHNNQAISHAANVAQQQSTDAALLRKQPGKRAIERHSIDLLGQGKRQSQGWRLFGGSRDRPSVISKRGIGSMDSSEDWSNGHSRGISNTTPSTNYLHDLKSKQGAPRIDREAINTTEQLPHLPFSAQGPFNETAADIQIELAVSRLFGHLPNISQQSFMHASKEHDGDASVDTEHQDIDGALPMAEPSSGHVISRSTHDVSSRPYRHSAFVAPRRTASFGSQMPTGSSSEIQSIAALPDNSVCGDCGAPDPRWASWALNGLPCCIFLCIACSGMHRSLGVNVSKVRSVDLDNWTGEQLQAARVWGNVRVNGCYEASKPHDITPNSLGGTQSRSFWIKKYVDKAWYREKIMSHASQPDDRRSNLLKARRELPTLNENTMRLGDLHMDNIENVKVRGKSKRRPLSTLH